jgi:hypothetical protein
MPLLYCRYGRGREVDRGARGLGKPSRAEEIPPPTTPTTTNGFYNTNSWGVDLFQSIRPRRSPCCLCLMQFNLRVSLCKRGVVPHRAWTAARSPPYITPPGGFLRCDPSHLYTIIFIIAVRLQHWRTCMRTCIRNGYALYHKISGRSGADGPDWSCTGGRK